MLLFPTTRNFSLSAVSERERGGFNFSCKYQSYALSIPKLQYKHSKLSKQEIKSDIFEKKDKRGDEEDRGRIERCEVAGVAIDLERDDEDRSYTEN